MDTLQNAISCVFSHDLLRFGMSDRVITWITRILLLAINIPAIIMSSQRYDVIGLFLVADIVCATAVFPVFLGLITEDIWWFLPAPTELAAFLGKSVGTEMARTAVSKEINNYIQTHNLKDKNNGRIIHADAKLTKLLKLQKDDELTYFNLQKYMKHHFPKPAA